MTWTGTEQLIRKLPVQVSASVAQHLLALQQPRWFHPGPGFGSSSGFRAREPGSTLIWFSGTRRFYMIQSGAPEQVFGPAATNVHDH